ncbi:LysM peptidoglycan-binding domain-containing protein [Luteimonas sp. RD2P54]|uniref:LysM peptidoglycan-binding domain-containing protein n=1 Tax=Luteimonas endophytica TaxID=3042023 RepID=A0ABT6J9F8_9GAMM|nr:LysM peptidoglycan-binding domain-containing protein [Luteimonas endophytica]MDH5823441.1 LysM peptidoglycan-binding domain-containing protein [Luteimonas endophytica]
MTEVQLRNETSTTGHTGGHDAVHTIARGETLGALAQRYGVGVDALLQSNPQIRNPDLIYAGDRLSIPDGGQQSYQVRSGDTLGAIARTHGTTVEALAAANNIRNPDLIFPGDRLVVPAAQPSPEPAPPVSGPAPEAPPVQGPAPGTGAPPPAEGPFDYEGIVGVRGNPNVTPEFIAGVEAMAERLGAQPEHLLAVMSFETGGSFDPGQRNMAGSGATGLIQFMPATARGLGTTTAELAAMGPVQQLEYVERYFAQYPGQLDTLEGVYTSVLSGRATPDPDATLRTPAGREFVQGNPEYTQNSGLDFDRDGRITAGEATQAVAARLYGGVSAVQQQLLDAGVVPAALRDGFVDGEFGRNTSAAVRAFQDAHGLPATGLLDAATGAALSGGAAPPAEAPAPAGDLQLSQPVHERGTPGRQTITSPVLGEFILTEGFMARGGPHSAKREALAVYSDNPGVAERVPAGVYNLGIDYVATDGRIRSWFDGTVQEIRHDAGGYGNYVITRTDATFEYQGRDYPVHAHYAHADSFDVRPGDRIRAGQDIGPQGSTGGSTGDHVDFLAWINVDGQRVFLSPNLLAGAR